MNRIGWVAAIGAVTLVAGCTTAPQMRVTRFHLGQAIAEGRIAVEPLVPADRASPEFQTYASVVGEELARIGFTREPGLAPSEQVAVVAVDRGTREALARRAPLTIGLGGGFGGGSYGWHGGGGGSIGGGVSIPVGRPRSNLIIVTRLVVQIKRRSEGSVIWEGRAETAAPEASEAAQPAAAVRRLAHALFTGFPGESGKTVVVR